MIISEWLDSEDEKSGILSLTKKVFGDTHVSKPLFFDWQYRQNPQGKAVISLAKNGQDNNSIIIGVEAILPMKLMVDQQIVTGALSCNSAVDPNYRKKGIFSQLISSIQEKSIERGISCIYGVANDKSVEAFIKKGSAEIVSLPILVKPLRLSKYFDSFLGKLIQPFDVIWKVKLNNNPNVKKQETQFNSDFDLLVDKASKRFSIIQRRDKDFLIWRYEKHPIHKYQIFVLKQGSVLKGYVITTQTMINGKKIGIIVDLLVDETANEKELKDLIDISLVDFWENNVLVAIATCRPGLFEWNLLRKSGFFKVPEILKPQPLHFILIQKNSQDHCLDKLKQYKSWYFSFGDYDIF
ncbi:MAG: GNAT family N-acetyltransferase [Nitrosotalea sp.]